METEDDRGDRIGRIVLFASLPRAIEAGVDIKRLLGLIYCGISPTRTWDLDRDRPVLLRFFLLTINNDAHFP